MGGFLRKLFGLAPRVQQPMSMANRAGQNTTQHRNRAQPMFVNARIYQAPLGQLSQTTPASNSNFAAQASRQTMPTFRNTQADGTNVSRTAHRMPETHGSELHKPFSTGSLDSALPPRVVRQSQPLFYTMPAGVINRAGANYRNAYVPSSSFFPQGVDTKPSSSATGLKFRKTLRKKCLIYHN